jgi:hypothetical protein
MGLDCDGSSIVYVAKSWGYMVFVLRFLENTMFFLVHTLGSLYT